MCISTNPAEFKGTVLANYPALEDSDRTRVLSYMNTVQSPGTSREYGVADTGPNAMLFPVYGEVRDIADCRDPEASRTWLSGQAGVYQEFWVDESTLRGGSAGERRIYVAGNYLVSVADNIRKVPGTLEWLKREVPYPEHVPAVSDYLLESVERFYQVQGLGMPQFVVAAFALPPHCVDQKNPITLTYEQSDNVANSLVFPALDYHGMGRFEDYVKRDHSLLLSTNQLNEMFRSVMTLASVDRPTEFNLAPPQFPMSVCDTRSVSGELDSKAPNNDYIFDMATIHAKLEGAQAEIEALGPMDPTDGRAYYARREQIARIVAQRLGRYGVMEYSNQPVTTAEKFAKSGFGDSHFIEGIWDD